MVLAWRGAPAPEHQLARRTARHTRRFMSETQVPPGRSMVTAKILTPSVRIAGSIGTMHSRTELELKTAPLIR